MQTNLGCKLKILKFKSYDEIFGSMRNTEISLGGRHILNQDLQVQLSFNGVNNLEQTPPTSRPQGEYTWRTLSFLTNKIMFT